MRRTVVGMMLIVLLALSLPPASLASAQGNYSLLSAPIASGPGLADLGAMDLQQLDKFSIASLDQLDRLVTPAQPQLTVTLFGGGMAAEDYFLTDEGFQLEQSLTQGIGLVGRLTGYQLWIEQNATSPLAPSKNAVNRLNFGRAEAGFDLSPWQGFNFVMLGGHDFGDSDAWIIEADISMWFAQTSAHPINLFVAPVHDFQNGVTSSEIDVRVVAWQNPEWMLLLGAGGAVYGGGFISGLEGQGGGIVGVFNRVWQAGGDLQVGGGTPGVYGLLTLYKSFTIPGL